MEKLLINCEAQAVKRLLEEAAAWDGMASAPDADPTQRAKAARNAEACRRAAANALARSDVEDPFAEAACVVALDEAELAQKAVDDAEGEACAAEEAACLANELVVRERVRLAIAKLEQAHANWASLTPAEKDAALKLNVRVTVGLARLALRELASA